MKTIALLFSVLVGLPSFASSFESIQFGLDSSKKEVREKTPVIIYIGNDIMAPISSAQLLQDVNYLEFGLKGKQLFVGSETPQFTNEELESFKNLPMAERDFLGSVGQQVLVDVSRWESGVHADTLRYQICKPNPKYRAGLVVLRNHEQTTLNAIKEFGFRWMYCGEGPDQVLASEKTTEFRSLGESLFTYPASEQFVTHKGALRKLLQEVASIYPTDKYRYIVMVHSNSFENRVLSPHFPSAYNKIPIEKIREAVLNHKADFLTPEGKVKADRSFATVFDKAIQSVVPEIKRDLGIEIGEFFEILGSIEGAQYPLLVLDTNKLDFSEFEKTDLPRIGTILYSQDPAPTYKALSLNGLFDYVGVKEKDIEDRLVKILTK